MENMLCEFCPEECIIAKREKCDLRGRKHQEAGENCVMRSFHNLYSSPNIVFNDQI
jgi:hypothetical protein